MTSSNGNSFRFTGPLCGECTGTDEFPAQRPMTRSFDVFFDLRPNKRLSTQSWSWWFKTPSWSSWRHCNGMGDRTTSTLFKWYSLAIRNSRSTISAENIACGTICICRHRINLAIINSGNGLSPELLMATNQNELTRYHQRKRSRFHQTFMTYGHRLTSESWMFVYECFKHDRNKRSHK